MQKSKPSLVRNRPTTPETEKEKKIAEKGYDKPNNQSDPDDKKTRDFSVPLNEYYHKRFEDAIKAMGDNLGVAGLKRRPLAAKALRDFIDKLAKENGLDD